MVTLWLHSVNTTLALILPTRELQNWKHLSYLQVCIVYPQATPFLLLTQTVFHYVFRMACSHYSNVVFFYTFYVIDIAKLKIIPKKVSIFKVQGFDRMKPCYSVEGMFTERHVK